MELQKRYFNSDIDVTINLSDQLSEKDKLLYITLTYQYQAEYKTYRLSSLIDLVYVEKDQDDFPVSEHEIDPKHFLGDLASREQDAIGIVNTLMPELELKRCRKQWLN